MSRVRKRWNTRKNQRIRKKSLR